MKKASPSVAVSKPKPTTSIWAKRRKSGIHGWGMFATQDIPPGTRIIEYVGEKITKAETIRREDERLARRKRGGAGHVWVFELNKTHDIDGGFSWNTARHINHSCDPNCETQIIRGRIWVVSLCEIKTGEELTFDYSFDYSIWRDHPCRCGSSNCPGYIVNADQRWRVKKILAAEAKARSEQPA